MSYKVISFHTEVNKFSTFYGDCAKKFRSQCIKYNLDFFIAELRGHKDYYLNCKLKPLFIKKCLLDFDQPVLWIDIDSRINGRPNLSSVMNKNCDLAFVRRQPEPCQHALKLPIYAHCLYFNNTKKSKNFISSWIKNCMAIDGKKHLGDHSILCKTLEEQNMEYSFINDTNLTPVISHDQRQGTPEQILDNKFKAEIALWENNAIALKPVHKYKI